MSTAIRERPIVLDQPFEGLPGEVEAVERGVSALQKRDHAQRLGIVIEAPARGQTTAERPFSGMAKRRVAKVVGKRERFRKVLVEAKRPRQRARDLGDFERMGEPGAEMVAFVKNK